ncbi:TPA: DUF2817 domain-containing protein [Streptococcus suis]
MIELIENTPSHTQVRAYMPITDEYSIPYTLIKGRESHPLVLITAGIHGCEYVGMKTSMSIVKDIEAKQFEGSVLLFHAVNLTGFYQKITTLVPEDRVNLNRIFQDTNRYQTVSYQIKQVFREKLLPHVDYLLDLHGGNKEELLTPHVYYSLLGDKATVQASERLVQVSGSPIIFASSNVGGLYQAAAIDYKIPSILIEQGDSGTCLPEDIQKMKVSLLHLLEYIFEEKEPVQTQQVYYKKYYSFSSSYLACWFCFVKPGDRVEKGQFIGQLHTIHGEVLEDFFALESGTVLYQKANLITDRGESLITIAY